MSRALGQTTEAHLHQAELPPADAKRMLDLRAHAGLAILMQMTLSDLTDWSFSLFSRPPGRHSSGIFRAVRAGTSWANSLIVDR